MLARSKSVLVAAVLLAALALVPSAQARKSCARPGDKASERTAELVFLSRDLHWPSWEEGPYYSYACSLKYHRRVFLTSEGINGDGEDWVDLTAGNSRYAAVVTVSGDNADLSGNDWLGVFDLKTGKRLISTEPGPVADEEISVSALALGTRGAVAWIANGVVRTRRPGERTRVLARGETVDPGFLRFDDTGELPVWSAAPRGAAIKRRKDPAADPIEHARCLRAGDSLLAQKWSSVTASRKFVAPGWSHARTLVACSRDFHRRIVLGHSGEFGGATYAYGRPVFDSRTAVVETSRTAADGSVSRRVSAYDLGTGERTCTADASESFAGAVVSAIAMDYDGSVAWLARGTALADPVLTTEVRVCDARGVRTVATGADIDPSFIRFGEEGDPPTAKVVWSGPATTAAPGP